MDGRRYSWVPWLQDEQDLRRMGDPEHTVRTPDDITHALWIPLVGPGTMLIVTARRDGRITLAIQED